MKVQKSTACESSRKSTSITLGRATFGASISVVASADEIEQLYARYSRSVYRRARELLGDDEAARDATHEVFLRVMRAGGKIPPSISTPTAWFHRVTTNLCLNQLRDSGRRLQILASDYQYETVAEALGEPRAIVRDVLSRVPDELQEIAIYFFLDELTYDEIAALTGLSARTVCSRLTTFRDLISRLSADVRSAS